MRLSRRDMSRLIACGLCAGAAPAPSPSRVFDIRGFGAVGDGHALDTEAVNRCILAASQAGGGIVHVPPGSYACHSIRLRSNIVLYLGPDATILAADPPDPGSPAAGYDDPEPNPFDLYQDFGHSHWHNSLIWGDGLHDVAILGPGRIWGRGLVRQVFEPGQPYATQPGVAEKAIALVRCRNVVIRSISILRGGHFGILATGTDDLSIDQVRIDTDRDGINVDCCHRVQITDCTVNSPFDDGICLKSSFALGSARTTESVVVSGCTTFGDYRMGTMLDGRFQPIGHEDDADPGQRSGRIKLGTESVGGFRDIVIKNCTFQGCRGLALETVDGGVLEDVTVSDLSMRDLRNSPLFLRLGARLDAPAGARPGILRRVIIRDIVCEGLRSTMPSIISGIPGHAIEDVEISHVAMLQKGGTLRSEPFVEPPEQIAAYPDPMGFKPLPAQGFFIRHARNLAFRDIEIRCAQPDARPAFWIRDATGIDIDGLRAPSSMPDAVSACDVSDLRLTNRPLVTAAFRPAKLAKPPRRGPLATG